MFLEKAKKQTKTQSKENSKLFDKLFSKVQKVALLFNNGLNNLIKKIKTHNL